MRRLGRTSDEPCHSRLHRREPLPFEEEGLEDDDSLLQAGIVESVGIVEVVAFLESEFHIRIARSEVTTANLDSVKRITSLVERKIAALDKTGPS